MISETSSHGRAVLATSDICSSKRPIENDYPSVLVCTVERWLIRPAVNSKAKRNAKNASSCWNKPVQFIRPRVQPGLVRDWSNGPSIGVNALPKG